jgi:hypothetical protein
MSCTCDCCTGAHVTTPASEENRPGLRRINHHPGTYATFFETMQARMASSDFPELAALRARGLGDPSIALCDAWAITADVLSFYQDRIANEGYLRTATERTSLLQLGRLTGYQLRPGVSASAYLAYTLDPNATNVDIAIGTRVQSVPGTGEKMQTFETAEPLSARSEWSEISVRLSQPQWRAPQAVNETTTTPEYGPRYNVLAADNGLYLDGTNTQLQENDALLIDYGNAAPTPYRVDRVVPDADLQRTKVLLRAWNMKGSGTDARVPSAGSAVRATAAALRTGRDTPQVRVATVVGELNKAPLQPQPRSALTLSRDIATTLRPGGEAFSRLLLSHVPTLRETLGPALQTANVTTLPPTPIKVYALRVRAGLFGDAAPNPVLFIEPVVIARHGAVAESTAYTGTITYNDLSVSLAWGTLDASIIPLNTTYDKIKPGSAVPSWIVVDSGASAGAAPQVLQVQGTSTVTMSIGSGFSAQVTQLALAPGSKWLANATSNLDAADLLRQAKVFAQSEELALAADPLIDVFSNDTATNEIELDKYYGGLTPGMGHRRRRTRRLHRSRRARRGRGRDDRGGATWPDTADFDRPADRAGESSERHHAHVRQACDAADLQLSAQHIRALRQRRTCHTRPDEPGNARFRRCDADVPAVRAEVAAADLRFGADTGRHRIDTAGPREHPALARNRRPRQR